MDNNKQTFYELFQSWSDEIKGDHPEADDTAWQSFRSHMFDGELDFNVGREFVKTCQTPMLILMGTDVYHPEVVSREIAELAPNATLVQQWKDTERDGTTKTVVDFLTQHTPS